MATNNELSIEIAEVKASLQEHLSVANVIDGHVRKEVKVLFIKLDELIKTVDAEKKETATLKTKIKVLETQNESEKESWKTVAAWVTTIVAVLTLLGLLVKSLWP